MSDPPSAGRHGRHAVPVLAVVGCCLAAGLAACGRTSAAPARASASTGSTYSLIQMNLCLSGLAGCYRKVEYPAGVDEAIARIRKARPDAVTISEACSGDVARIAARTGYHARSTKTIYHGRHLPCIRPGDRGLFGDAVLTRAAIRSTATGAFHAQSGPERRDWLCVDDRTGGEVCTAHLASRDPEEAAANNPQCAELKAVLARRAASGPLIFGGDPNRRGACAPAGFWTRGDGSAHQDPGSQQVYGSRAFGSPSATVLPAVHTDHDFLLVRATRAA